MESKYLKLITLVKSVINDNSKSNTELFTIIDDIEEWKDIYSLAVAHNVQVFLYEATSNWKLPDVVRKNFYSAYNREVRKEAIMHIEISNYLESLAKEKIKYLPLKGWNLKNIYPKPYLRSMTDVDVIVDKNGFVRACEIAKECGFSLETTGGNHYTFQKKPVTELEVHHQLFADVSPLYSWGKEVMNKNKEYIMSDEDTYIYIISHMASHFVHEGAGMRNIIDCYLINKNYLFSDEKTKYIKDILKELGLDIFEEKIRKLSKIWFEGDVFDIYSEQLTEYIMDGGLYGKAGNSASMQIRNETNNKSSNKFRWIIKEIFPNFEFLKFSLGYKKMYKILTPVYWIIRIIRGLKQKGKVKALTSVISMNSSDLDKAGFIIDYMGLKNTNY